MRAIVCTRYGGHEFLSMKEVNTPLVKDDEVLVKVHAVSINDWDFGLMQGDLVNRLFNGINKPKQTILGSDIAGHVEAIGKKVTRFRVGDEVYGDLSGRWGGFAELVCAPETALEFKPPSMSFVEAAAIPQAGMLAVQGLIDVGKIREGQKILINGAGGGVGTFAVQVAKMYGAEVTGVDSAGKLDMLRSIGFDHVLDYKQQDFTTTGLRYDLVLDTKTNRSIFEYAKSLNDSGSYVTVGGAIGKLLQAFIVGSVASRMGKKKFRIVALKPNKDLKYMNQLFEAGKLKCVIDGPFEFTNYAEAFRVYGNAEHKGKVVLKMD